jgi:hypothetical protein
METEILDLRIDNGNKCYLCKISLYQFITNLPDDYKDYDIQREIVSNIYLDTLIDTVLNFKHIPPIVLVVEKGNHSENNTTLNISTFKILDGLQRTYRLKIIWDTIKLFEAQLKNDKGFLNLNRLQLSRKFAEEFYAINSSSKVLDTLISFYKKDKHVELKASYTENFQWFEIWTDLTPEQEVEKMLILNAGHKPVKIKHQLELLFRNLLPVFKKIKLDDFKLIREKETSSVTYSKNRKYGQFHFSHLITSIISFKEGEPITTNTDLINEIQKKELDINEYKDFFTYEFFIEFIRFLLLLDKYLQVNYENDGIRWMGRETAMDGLFAALGKYSQEKGISPINTMHEFAAILGEGKNIFNLKEYEEARNRVELSKVNIGNVNKKAVFNAIYDVISLRKDNIVWKDYFNN